MLLIQQLVGISTSSGIESSCCRGTSLCCETTVGLVVGVGSTASAVVQVVASFQLEVSFPAAAQVFRAHETNEVGTAASTEDASHGVSARLGRSVSSVSLTVQSHGRLSERSARNGCQCSQSS